MYSIIWGMLFILFLIVEISTVNLVTIWFALGSIISFILSLFKVNITIQIIVFIIVSMLSILSTIPLVKKYKKSFSKTNIDLLIGQKCCVKESISTFNPGVIILNGIEWTAKSLDNIDIEKSSRVEIVKIEGTSAFVKKI